MLFNKTLCENNIVPLRVEKPPPRFLFVTPCTACERPEQSYCTVDIYKMIADSF